MQTDLYHAIGGIDGCRELSAAFYSHVEHDPVLRPVYPSTSFHCAIEALARFLGQFLGGPCLYSERRSALSLREAHLRFKIGPKERTAWLKNMFKAMEDVQIEEPARDALRRFFEESSAYLVNQQDGLSARTAQGAMEAPPNLIQQELAQRWDEQRTLDEIVARVREGDADRAMALIASSLAQSCFNRDPAAFVSLLVVMTGSGQASMINYVREKLASDPELVRGRYGSGRTLLHDAAVAGDPPIIEMLLQAGADPNATDQFGHAPLYCVGNTYSVKGVENIVRVLVQGGANVHAHDGIKHCTALHMAARRGNVPVAAALLDCGGDIEARDGLGDTALRRAVNCGKAEMAAFLLSRGADLHSIGSRGLTPQQAARGVAMKQVLSV